MRRLPLQIGIRAHQRERALQPAVCTPGQSRGLLARRIPLRIHRLEIEIAGTSVAHGGTHSRTVPTNAGVERPCFRPGAVGWHARVAHLERPDEARGVESTEPASQLERAVLDAT